MLKMFILLGFFFLLTALIWAMGLRQDEEAILKYLVFATQLLYGNMVYDLLKSMRSIPSNDKFWSSVSVVVIETSAWMTISITLLYIAAKTTDIAYVAYGGLASSFIIYMYIFIRVLPKFQPIYVEVQNRVPSSKL